GGEQMTGADNDPPPHRYRIRVRGHLGETMRSAFPTLEARARGGDTVLTGPLPDRASLQRFAARCARKDRGARARAARGPPAATGVTPPSSVVAANPARPSAGTRGVAPGRAGCQQAKGAGARNSVGAAMRAELDVEVAQIGPDVFSET